MNPLIQLKQTTSIFLIAFGLACFGPLPPVQAVSPAPDGGYPNLTTAEGENALNSLTIGVANTAVGWFSLSNDTSGQFNTGVGAGTLLYLSVANENTATGAGALLSNCCGVGNTANGALALISNSSGPLNTAVGDRALQNSTAGANTATGARTLLQDTTGELNTAVGFEALFVNTEGNKNTALGNNALGANTTGSLNTGIGNFAGGNVTTASNVTCIGADANGENVDNTTWIANVYGVTTQNATTAPVIVSADGQLGTVTSSERFKKDIAAMENASEAILSLRPVTFHYKTDSRGMPQFGLIAEEVAKVNPALVLPDKEGKPYTVRYDAVNAMLLNEFLKEHRTVQELKANNVQQQNAIKALAAMVKEQASQIQKVSAQLEVSKPAPQTVLNNH